MKNPLFPCLWFKYNGAEAAAFYCSVFTQTKITSQNPIVTIFESEGQKFMCLNGGPKFDKNPAVSFYVTLEEEEEVILAWEKLKEGGQVLMPFDHYPWSLKYGWVQDRFGVSWQLSLGRLKDVGQKFTPSFMFTKDKAGKAEEAIHFYTSVFDDSSVVGIMKYTADDPDQEGYVKHAQFKLNNQVFMAMDSSLSHNFQFNEGISMVIECDTQKEIDYFWEKLSAVPEAEQCGWLKDRFGISWQVVPSILPGLMNDPSKADRVMKAFLSMKKFNIEKLLEAANKTNH